MRRHLRRRGAAETGCLGDAQLAYAGERGEPLAERVEPRQLRLHLTELGGHRVEVLLHEGAAALGFAFLGCEHQPLQRGQRYLGSVAQGDPVDRRRGTQHEQQQNGAARHEMHGGQGD